MGFTSPIFLLAFLPAVLLIYYGALRFKHTWPANTVLMAAGLVFFGWNDLMFLPHIVVLTLVCFLVGRILGRLPRVGVLAGGIAAAAAVVAARYIPLFGGTALVTPLPLPQLVIALAALQGISYMVDVYQNNVETETNFIRFANFMMLFPKMPVGPMVRYSEMESALAYRTVSRAKIAEGISLAVKGLAKVVIFGRIGSVWTSVAATSLSPLTMASAWLGIIAGGLSFYFFLSGYCDMAAGIGRMLGFSLPQNINHPLAAISLSDFFRRINITLREWLCDYIYLPMGGRSGSRIKALVGALVCWAVLALLFGGSINVLLCSGYLFVMLIAERMAHGIIKHMPIWIRRTVTLLVLTIPLVLFMLPDLAQASSYLLTLIGMNGAPLADRHTLYLLTSNLIPFILAVLGATPLISRIRPNRQTSRNTTQFLRVARAVGEAAVYVVCICYIVA